MRKILTKYLPRLIAAFCFWGMAYSLWANGFGAGISELTKYALTNVVHLWFLPMLMGLYLLTPFLRAIVADERNERNFVIVGFFLVVLVPTLLYFMSDSFMLLRSGLAGAFENVAKSMTIGFAFYCVLGHYLSVRIKDEKLSAVVVISSLGMMSCLLGAWIMIHESILDGKANPSLMNTQYFFVFLIAVAIFMVCSKAEPIIRKNRMLVAFLPYLSKWVFGVYLVHLTVLRLLDVLGVNACMGNSFLFVPLVSLVIFIVSLAISALLSKIPIVNRFLI